MLSVRALTVEIRAHAAVLQVAENRSDFGLRKFFCLL